MSPYALGAQTGVTTPVLQALVLADQVYVDARTGKKVIAGTFNRLWSKQFPSQFGRTTYAYICLTNLRKADLKIQYVDDESDTVLMETAEIPIKADSPLDSVEFVVEVPGFPMPHVGIYHFEVLVSGGRLGGLRLTVAEPKDKP